MPERSLKALVYGDVNLNIIDGSAVWLASTAECLARCDVQVTVVLKARIITDRLVSPLREIPGISIIEPEENIMVPQVAAQFVTQLQQEHGFDLIIARGSRVVSSLVEMGTLRDVLWSYVTDIPQSVTALDADSLGELTTMARGSRKILCQTPELRSFVEAVVPGAAGRTVLWEPIIPDAPAPKSRASAHDRTLQVGYAGKFAPLWNTDLMLNLPARAAEQDVSIELHMVGDKIHREDLAFAERMEQGLQNQDRVSWHGGLDRRSTIDHMASWDVGLSWRDPALDSSLELSTKVLEYASVGTAPLINRTPMHERLFGSDYPLFVSADTPALDVLIALSRNREMIAAGATRARLVAEHFMMSAAVKRTRRMLDRAFPRSPDPRRRPLRIVVAGHDLKFMRGIADQLTARSDMEVRIDAWPALAAHDEASSREHLAWADVIVCEWAGPNAVWYSTRLESHQRLFIRLHRFELDAPWIRDVDTKAIERVICVNDHYRRRVIDETKLSADAVVTIPNAIDRDYFDRPKKPGAERRLGLLGIVPFRKRPDRALSLLRRLNQESRGFFLSFKSTMPWEHHWVWRRPDERAAYRRLFDEITLDPAVRDAVVLDRHGGDVAAWFQRIGWILSVSEDESFHLAPAEGMASGSIPVIRDWPGASDVYGTQYIAATEDDMVERILRISLSGAWDKHSVRARADFRVDHDLPVVAARWADLLLGVR